MNFHVIYRVSIGVMLILASITIGLDPTGENPLSPYYPLAVVVAVVASYFLVDRRSSPGLPRTWANLLALGSLVLAWIEFSYDPDSLILILGHWLIYLTVIKLALPKTVEDDWFLLLLGLTQVVIGVTLSQSDAVGTTLMAWAISTLWVLSLFYLHRESLRVGSAPGVAALPEATREEPYPGLIGAPFILATVRAAVVTLILGVAIFYLMPRNSRTERMTSARIGTPVHLTGFSESIQLGQFGEILENENVVMSIELLDEQGNVVEPPLESLWRGVAMARYEDRRWHRVRISPLGMKPRFGRPEGSPPLIRQRIKLEPTDSHVLFGLRPFIRARDPSNPYSQPEFNPKDGSLYRGELLPRSSIDLQFQLPAQPSGYDYEVASEPNPGGDRPQPQEVYPSDSMMKSLLSIPEVLKGRLKRIADRIVGDIPESDPAGRAARLSAWLSFSGEFHYTLRIEPVDRSIDPIEDFLVNRKQGNCEYFASGLALLLRAEDIPSRMISGFKGGDYSPLTRVLNVRQKHAHTWVEALVGRNPEGQPIWRTFDPTSGTERGQVVAQVGGVTGGLRAASDFVRFIWVFYVVGFNAERQERLLYGPLRRLAANAMNGFGIMGRHLWSVLGWLMDTRGGAWLVLLRGVLVTIGAGLILLALYRAGHQALRRYLGRAFGARGEGSALAVGIAFYNRAARLLAEYGLERPPAETPREFARRASTFLGARGPAADSVADVPAVVVDAFYRIRYGRFDPSPEELSRVEARLDALEAQLRGPAPDATVG